MDFKDEKLEIEYPCKWDFKVIGLEEKSVSIAVAKILDSKKYNLKHSYTSKGGKYVSFTLSVTLENDQERKEIYMQLSSNPDIKYVL